MNNLGAEFGRFAGGVINLTTKSGTNNFYGTTYEFLRNKVLNANTFFHNRAGIERPALTPNQFGADLGGPIVRDKLLFFGSYKGFRLRQGQSFTYTHGHKGDVKGRVFERTHRSRPLVVSGS